MVNERAIRNSFREREKQIKYSDINRKSHDRILPASVYFPSMDDDATVGKYIHYNIHT